MTFNPGATSSQPKSKLTQKSKRRVSLGVVVNAETGEVIEGGTGMVGVKRHSQRRHTVMNTSATVNRMKDAEEKRVCLGFLYAGVYLSFMGPSHAGCDSKEDKDGHSITDTRRTHRTGTRHRRGEHYGAQRLSPSRRRETRQGARGEASDRRPRSAMD